MKKQIKRLLSLCFVITVLFSSLIVQSTFAADSKRMVFLYAGAASTDGKKYPSYVSASGEKWISWLSSNANEFVVSSTGVWDVYQRDNLAAGRKYSDLAEDIKNCINEVLAVKPNAKIWVSVPPVENSADAAFDYTNIYYTKFQTYLTTLKSKIGTTIWTNNVVGVYFTTEAVSCDIYPASPTSNKMVKLMNDLSYYIRTGLSKKFLWAPFLGDTVNSSGYIKKLATVTNRTNIFDYVLLQPTYYFNSNYPTNLDAVYNSLVNQEVRDSKNNALEYYGVTLSRTSNATAQIGVQMEIDRNYSTDSGKNIRYDNSGNPSAPNAPANYVKRFNTIKSKYPISFYCGDASGLNVVYNKINDFYNW